MRTNKQRHEDLIEMLIGKENMQWYNELSSEEQVKYLAYALEAQYG